MTRILSTSLEWLAEQAIRIENRLGGDVPGRVDLLERQVADLRTICSQFATAENIVARAVGGDQVGDDYLKGYTDGLARRQLATEQGGTVVPFPRGGGGRRG